MGADGGGTCDVATESSWFSPGGCNLPSSISARHVEPKRGLSRAGGGGYGALSTFKDGSSELARLTLGGSECGGTHVMCVCVCLDMWSLD